MIVAAPVNIPPALDEEKSENNRADGNYKAELAELKLECEELRAALQAARTRPDPVRLSDFERYVQLAAQGLAKRETYPLPTSVKTPEAFYVVMACAALDATGLWEPSAAQTGDPTEWRAEQKVSPRASPQTDSHSTNAWAAGEGPTQTEANSLLHTLNRTIASFLRSLPRSPGL